MRTSKHLVAERKMEHSMAERTAKRLVAERQMEHSTAERMGEGNLQTLPMDSFLRRMVNTNFHPRINLHPGMIQPAGEFLPCRCQDRKDAHLYAPRIPHLVNEPMYCRTIKHMSTLSL